MFRTVARWDDCDNADFILSYALAPSALHLTESGFELMAYEPLHHKYRPQTFADLVGQAAIATTLTNALTSQRIAPAYLFAGPRGTGKTSSARILAKSLNCLAHPGPTPTPCGHCDVCLAIARSVALDVIEIDAASNTGVDNIREMIERSQFAPVQCRYKVYVIDECHMLSVAAFNALLKTLEEPPERVVFVLATTDPQRVLPTIISRCQRFDYRRIPLDAMCGHLKFIAHQEAIEITDEALALVAQMANGGLRDAESLLDQLSLLSEAITPERVWDLVGTVPEQSLLALLSAIAADQSVEVIEQCRALLDRGREPLMVLQNLAGFLLSLLMAKTAPHRQDLATVTAQTWPQLCRQAQQWQLSQILQAQQHLKDSEGQIKHTTQPRLWLEVTLLGLLPSRLSQAMAETPGTSVATAPAPPSPMVQPIAKQPASTLVPKTAPGLSPQAESPQISQDVSVTTSVNADTNRQTKPKSSASPGGELSSTASTTTLASPSSAQTEAAAPSAAASESPPQIWQNVLGKLPPLIKALVHPHGQLLQLTPTIALIGIKSESLRKLAQAKIPQLEAVFADICQRRIKVNLQVSSVDTASIPSQATPPGTNETVSSTTSANATPSMAVSTHHTDLPPATVCDLSEATVTQAPATVVPPENPPQPPRSIPQQATDPIGPLAEPTVPGAITAIEHSLAESEAPETPAVQPTQIPSLSQPSSQQAAESLATVFEGEILSSHEGMMPETFPSTAKTPSITRANGPALVEAPKQPVLDSSQGIRGRPDLSQLSEDDEDIPF